MMGFAACLGLAVGFGLTGAANRPSGSPAANGWPAAGVVQHAATNDWKGARQEYEAVDWRKVAAPLPPLRQMAEAIRAESGPEARALRREIHTKYWLLRGERDPELGRPDERVTVPVVQAAVVTLPMVEASVIEVPDVAFPRFRFTNLEIVELQPEVLAAMGVAAVVVSGEATHFTVLRIQNRAFLEAVSRWERRYGRRLDFWDSRGGRIVPAHGTVLWEMRRRVIERVEAGGEYEVLWAKYDAAFSRAMGRRADAAKDKSRRNTGARRRQWDLTPL